jgi:hypothetical protein
MKIQLSKSREKLDEFKKVFSDITLPAEVEVVANLSSDELDERMSYVWRDISALYEKIYQLRNDLYNEIYTFINKHEEGHLPKIQGPEKMQKAIEAIGLGGDYEVMKRVIYASNGARDEEVIEFRKKCKPGSKGK